jgi:hypothetical protein
MLVDKIGPLTETARLVSPSLSQSGLFCEIEFYYFKSDEDLTLLAVYIISGDTTQRICSTSDSTIDDGWKKISVGINRRISKFNILFEGILIGVVEPNFKTELAIDDVSLKNCQKQTIQISSTSKTSTFSAVCPTNVCNNGGSCNYSLDKFGECICDCICLSTFVGSFCENVKQTDKKCNNFN